MATITQKLLFLLTPKERKRALVMIFLMFISMIVETMGIGLVIPTLAVFMQPDFLSNYSLFEPVISALGNPTQSQLIIGMLFILVVVYLFKSLILGFSLWWQMRFVFDVQAGLSGRIFKSYLKQSYSFHLNRNSAQLLRNSVTEVTEFNSRILVPGTQLIGETLIVLGIVLLLLTIQPLAAVITFSILIILSWGFYALIRSKLVFWGEARQLNEGLRIQHIQQGLGAIKDVKLLAREDEFFEKFDVHNNITASMSRNRATVVELPRLWLEVVAIVGLTTLVTVMLYQGKSVEEIMPFLGLFAVAAFRLLPSANRILGSIQSLRFGLPVVETLYRELNYVSAANDSVEGACSNVMFNSEICINNMSFFYPETSNPAINNLNLSIYRGESVGFIGESGSGKSTLVDIVLGLLSPTNGKVMVDSQDIQVDLKAWQKLVGYVPQSIYLTDDTLRRNIALGLPEEKIDDEAIRRAISAAQLDSCVESLPEGLNTFVGERGVRLSGGQRQRIGIARALYQDPEVLVLDEATSALDNETEQGVMQSVNRLHGEKTIIIIAHRMSTLKCCDRVFRLDKGSLVQEGRYDEVVGL